MGLKLGGAGGLGMVLFGARGLSLPSVMTSVTETKRCEGTG